MFAPTERTMGDVQRIFYYHLPSGWVAFLLFFINFLASIWSTCGSAARPRRSGRGLGRSGRRLLHRAADHRAAVGAPGLGHLVDVGRAPDDHAGAVAHLRQLSRAAAVRRRRPDASAGCGIRASSASLDVPIVYMSIRWFRTQHPSPVMGGGENSGLDPAMLHVFLINLALFTVMGILFVWLRYKLQMQEQALESAHAQAALKGVSQ